MEALMAPRPPGSQHYIHRGQTGNLVQKIAGQGCRGWRAGEENMETLHHTMPNGVRRLLTASSVSPCHGHKQQK
ncbi:uncharacterized [Tachysurus ichikawai]